MSEQLLNIMRQWLEQLEPIKPNSDRGDDWQSLQAHFSRQTHQGNSPFHADLLYRVTRQSEQFQQFAEELIQLCDEQNSVDTEVLIERFRSHLNRLNLAWVLSSWPLPEQLAAALALLIPDDSPLQQGLQQLTPLLQQLLGNLSPHLQPSILEQLHTRLQQLEAFEQARTDYLNRLGRITQDALTQLQQQLGDRQIDEIEQLHLLWIQCYEQAYQQQLQQHAYQQAFGDLCNAAMRLRLGWQQQLDQLYAACGLVTLAQYDELSRQHHELRRRVRDLERQLAATSAHDDHEGSDAPNQG